MREKFKIIVFFILLMFIQTNITLNSEEIKKISIIKNINQNISTNDKNIITYLIDDMENKMLSKYKNLNIVYNDENLLNFNVRQISNKIFINREDGFFYIDASNDKKNESVNINIKLYSSLTELIDEANYKINVNEKFDNIDNEKQNSWNDLFFLSIEKLLSKKIKNILLIKQDSKFLHDFPFLNISLNALSVKLYFDTRTTTKLFSIFPLDLKFSYFPLKYFEFGAFIRFNVNDMVYKYYDIKNQNYGFYDSSFDFSYGIFAGFSYFADFFHYSLGAQIFNLYYDLNNKRKFTKTENIDSYLLPQFGLYQKLDIKIYKVIYYSVFFNIKTIPLFYLEDNYFYSKPLKYDFVSLEVSFLGFSVIF
jgi:hypothetical protein